MGAPHCKDLPSAVKISAGTAHRLLTRGPAPGKSIECGGSRQARPPDVNQRVIGNLITITAEVQAGSVYVKPEEKPSATPIPQ